MASLLIRNIPDDLVDELKSDARRNGRSMQAEVLNILEAAANQRRRNRDFWERADGIRALQNPTDEESWEQIHEDRERGYRDEE